MPKDDDVKLMNKSGIYDFDHVEDKSGRIFQVVGNDHPIRKLRVCLVYAPTTSKSDYKKGQKYYIKINDDMGNLSTKLNFSEIMYTHKKTMQTFIAISKRDVKKIFKPKDGLKKLVRLGKYPSLNKFVSILENFGINLDQIGIIGSLLFEMNKPTSDFDLIIYGTKNLNLYKKNIQKIYKLGFKSFTKKHISKLTFSAMRNYPIGFQSMYKIKSARKDTLFLTTDEHDIFSIHFATTESKQKLKTLSSPISTVKIQGFVVDASEGYFRPHKYTIQTGAKKYVVTSYALSYYSAVRKDDRVEVLGTLRDQMQITLDESHHYIVPLK